jgi:xanthine/CO dehydrogenase XdhC/CoxF family maturation factor
MLVSHSARVRLRPAIRQAASTQWPGSRSQIWIACWPVAGSPRPPTDVALVVHDGDRRTQAVSGGDVVEPHGAVAADGRQDRSVGRADGLLDEAAAPTEGADRLERFEVVLRELASQRAGEQLVGVGDEDTAG